MGTLLNNLTETDQSVLADIDLEAQLACSHDECDSFASYLIICPLCGAHEGLCAPHAKQVITAPAGSFGTFTKTCGHSVEQSLIRVIPI